MMCNLQSTLLLLLFLCTVQLFLVFHLIQINNVHDKSVGMKTLLKEINNQNLMLQKRSLISKRRRPSSGINNNDVFIKKLNNTAGSCEVIHVAIVCAGSNSVRTVQPLLKSMLFFRRRNPIHLHLIVDKISLLIFHRLLTTWGIPSLKFSYYHAEQFKSMVDWVPNVHYSGIYGLLKLVLIEILPTDLHKVIVLDTDITCNSDIAELWNIFEKFNSKQVIGLVDNQSNWYLKPNHWPAMGRGYNTGVVLMNLFGLRMLNWTQLWNDVTSNILKSKTQTHLADQDIFNAVLKANFHLLYPLPCEWNVQLNENALSQWCYLREESVFKMIHWNSPSKDRVHNRDSETFRKTYLAFAEYDGDLLKKEIFGCEMKPRRKSPSSNEGFRDKCYLMRKTGNTTFRTHLYFLKYEDFRWSGTGNETDVTFVTQLSIDRILMLETIANQWTGPISAAIYASDSEALSLVDFVSTSPTLRKRTNIGYHIVYKQGSNWQTFYPINYLRNVAKEQVQTDFQLLSDVDFIPKMKLKDYLVNVINFSPINMTLKSKMVLVLPAFETTLHKFSLPINKRLLVTLWERNIVSPFRFGMWKAGQYAVNYTHWKNAVEPYEVEWTQNFEPFIVASKFAPHFDNRFVGFGWNKVSYTITLHSQGYKFMVLPEGFLVHLPHSPSISNNKFRLDSIYRRCMHDLKKDFLDEISHNLTDKQIEVEL